MQRDAASLSFVQTPSYQPLVFVRRCCKSEEERVDVHEKLVPHSRCVSQQTQQRLTIAHDVISHRLWNSCQLPELGWSEASCLPRARNALIRAKTISESYTTNPRRFLPPKKPVTRATISNISELTRLPHMQQISRYCRDMGQRGDHCGAPCSTRLRARAPVGR